MRKVRAVFSGWTADDFDAMTVPGLAPRMERIRAEIQPKFIQLAEHFEPWLTRELGVPMHTHVAKHARRTVHPPESTWVAFSADNRGYKKHPHFQIGLFSTHVFALFGYIDEGVDKAAFGSRVAARSDDIFAMLPGDFAVIEDHTSPEWKLVRDLGPDGLKRVAERLTAVKKAEMLIGRIVARDEAANMTGPTFVRLVEEAFASARPLYEIARPMAQN